MTFVLILIEVWIWERDNVSFYANGHKDPKKTKTPIKTQNKKKISKNIPYTTQLLKGSFQR